MDLPFFTIIISVLSILVTLLIGFQVYTLIDFNGRISRAKKEIEEKSKEIVEKAKNDAAGLALAQLGLSQYHSHDYENGIRSLFNALALLFEGNRDTDSETAISHAVDLLFQISTDEQIISLSLDRFSKDLFLKTACNIPDQEKREKIILFVATSAGQ